MRNYFTVLVLLAIYPASAPADDENLKLIKCNSSFIALSTTPRPLDDSSKPRTFLQKLVSLVPDNYSWSLSHRSADFRKLRIEKLQRDVAELVPPAAAQFMTLMPQTSHDYLLLELPKIPKAQKLAEENIKNNPMWPDFMIDGERRNVQKKEWMDRLQSARSKLLEILELQKQDSSEKTKLDLAMTHLSLAVLYSFSYGFEYSMNQKIPMYLDIIVPKNGGVYASNGVEHYKKTLSLLKEVIPENSDPVVITEYLLGKHALNALQAYSNAGRYKMSNWEAVPTEPEALGFAKLSQEMLVKVITALKPNINNVNQGFGKYHEIYFESMYQLAELYRWTTMLNMREVPYTQMAKDFRGVLVDLLNAAPERWISSQMSSRYGIVNRILTRLSLSLERSSKEGMAVSKILQLNEISYKEMIRILIDEAGFIEIHPPKQIG